MIKLFWCGAILMLTMTNALARNYAYLHKALVDNERQYLCEGGEIDQILSIQKLPDGVVEPFNYKVEPGFYNVQFRMKTYKKSKSGCLFVTGTQEKGAQSAVEDTRNIGNIKLNLRAGKIYFIDINKSFEGVVTEFDEYPLTQRSLSELTYVLILTRKMLLDCRAEYPVLAEEFSDAYNKSIVSKLAKKFGIESMIPYKIETQDSQTIKNKASAPKIFSDNPQCNSIYFELISDIQDLYGHREEEISNFVDAMVFNLQ